MNVKVARHVFRLNERWWCFVDDQLEMSYILCLLIESHVKSSVLVSHSFLPSQKWHFHLPFKNEWWWWEAEAMVKLKWISDAIAAQFLLRFAKSIAIKIKCLLFVLFFFHNQCFWRDWMCLWAHLRNLRRMMKELITQSVCAYTLFI